MARDIVAYCNGLSKTEFWSLGMGDVQNLLDEALEEVERLRAEIIRHGWTLDCPRCAALIDGGRTNG